MLIIRASIKTFRFLSLSPVSSNVADPFRVLGIERGSSKNDVKKAYRRKAKQCHPDLFPNDKKKLEQFRLVQESYELIKSGKVSNTASRSYKGNFGHQSNATTSSQKESRRKPGSGPTGEMGWDFDQNYRRRMEMRQEWERMAKEAKDKERRDYQDRRHNSDNHYSRFDSGAYSNTSYEQEPWKESTRNARGPNSRRRQFYEEQDFSSRAERVYETMNSREDYQTGGQKFNQKMYANNEFARQWREKHDEIIREKEAGFDHAEIQRRKRQILRNVAIYWFTMFFAVIGITTYFQRKRRLESEEGMYEEQKHYVDRSRRAYNQQVAETVRRQELSQVDQDLLKTLEANSRILKDTKFLK